MSGLLERALEIRNQIHSVLADGDFVIDERSGISKDDQREIIQEIEKVTEQSRITVTPETMAIKAMKKGFLFPLLVNILFIVLLAGGGYTLFFLFQRGETSMMEGGGAITSTEGKLIEELKKQSEEALQAKNREINNIQAELQNIDQQRRDLQANMDERIAAREAELRSALEEELAAERERLRQQGVSEADITARLENLESEKTAQVQSELETFRRQAEAQRLRQEENLRTLQQEYQQDLAQAESERRRVLEESEEREAELLAQIDAQSAELEQATLEAKAELNQLAAQQEKQALAAGQLTGFYSRVKEDIQEGDFDGALTDLEAIKEYLDDPSVAGLPNILERREIELFVVDSISSLVRSEMQKAEADPASLIASADLINTMKNSVIQGDTLLSQGDIEGAEASYREALELIPEVGEAHAYFLENSGGISPANRQALRESLSRAEDAFDSGDYAAAIDSYTRAVSYLPEDPATIEKMVDQMRRSGFELRLAQLRRRDSSSAEQPLAAAEQLYEQESYDRAILAYIDLIAAYPNSTQVTSAMEGIRNSVEALAEGGGGVGIVAVPGTGSADGEELAAAKGRIQELEERANSLAQELESKITLIETLESEKTSMEQEIASLNQEIETLEGRIADMEAEQATALENLDEEIQQRLTRLQNVERRYNTLMENYREYARREDALVAAQGEERGLIQSKVHLNAFLSSTEAGFPGLLERIKRYDEAFERAGRASAAQDLSDILFELDVRERPESRELFLESEKTRYSDVPEMVDLIDDLRVLLRE